MLGNPLILLSISKSRHGKPTICSHFDQRRISILALDSWYLDLPFQHPTLPRPIDPLKSASFPHRLMTYVNVSNPKVHSSKILTHRVCQIPIRLCRNAVIFPAASAGFREKVVTIHRNAAVGTRSKNSFAAALALCANPGILNSLVNFIPFGLPPMLVTVAKRRIAALMVTGDARFRRRWIISSAMYVPREWPMITTLSKGCPFREPDSIRRSSSEVMEISMTSSRVYGLLLSFSENEVASS
jgi:hypothetical protein